MTVLGAALWQVDRGRGGTAVQFGGGMTVGKVQSFELSGTRLAGAGER